MDVVSCENVYVSCSVNCYPHCLETKENFIVFGSSNSIVLYDLNVRYWRKVCRYNFFIIIYFG